MMLVEYPAESFLWLPPVVIAPFAFLLYSIEAYAPFPQNDKWACLPPRQVGSVRQNFWKCHSTCLDWLPDNWPTRWHWAKTWIWQFFRWPQQSASWLPDFLFPVGLPVAGL